MKSGEGVKRETLHKLRNRDKLIVSNYIVPMYDVCIVSHKELYDIL